MTHFLWDYSSVSLDILATNEATMISMRVNEIFNYLSQEEVSFRSDNGSGYMCHCFQMASELVNPPYIPGECTHTYLIV